MAYNIFVFAIAFYAVSLILSVLDTMGALTMRGGVRTVAYWIEKVAGVVALVSGILYMTM